MRILKTILTILFITLGVNSLSAQSYTYSYTDPCTGQLKQISVPINGTVAVSYYGELQSFTYNQIINGQLEQWANNVFSQFGGNNPCASIIGMPTAISVTQTTVYNTLGIINSLSTIADIAGGSSNMLAGTLATVNTSSDNNSDGGGSSNTKKSKNSGSNNNSNGTSTGSNSQGTNAGTGQNSGNQSSNQNTNTNGNTNNTNGGTGNGSNTSTNNQSGNSSSSVQTSGTSSSNSSSSSSNSGGTGSTNTNSGSNSSSSNNSGSNGSSSGNGNGSNGGSGNGNSQGNSGNTGGGEGSSPGNNTQGQTTVEEEGGQTNILGGTVTSVRNESDAETGASGGGGKSAGKSEGGKPTVVASSDFVGFNFKNSEVTTGLKATGGYTSLRWDGARAHGVLVDYTSAQLGPNITGFYAWLKPKRTTLLSGTLTLGFEGLGSQYASIAFGQMRSFTKVPKLKVVYMGTVSMGYVYKEAFLGTAVIAGGMYDFKIGKRADIKLMSLFIYAPYVSYYNDIVLNSPYVVMPSIGTNLAVTKRFKFNINAGGAWAIKESALNYTVTCGTRLLIGQ